MAVHPLAVHGQMCAQTGQQDAQPPDQGVEHRVHVRLVRDQLLEQPRVCPRWRDRSHAQQRIEPAHLAPFRVAHHFPPQALHAGMLEDDSRHQAVPDARKG